tara:strand:- start:320 stop:1327 length:1008 start_codon:yes stop_codon:yes gene_type:complete
MAETKLTKAEQKLKKTNPKKFAELMKRRQGSSARRMRLSQQKKAEDAGSRKTTARGGIASATLGAGPAAMGIIRAGSGLYQILNDKSNQIFRTISEAKKAAQQKGKFKVGDKSYNTLAAANKARRMEKSKMEGAGKPAKVTDIKTRKVKDVKPLSGAAKRTKLEEVQKATDKIAKTAGQKRITTGAKRARFPATLVSEQADAAQSRPKLGPKPAAAKKPAPAPKTKPRTTIADVKKKPNPPVKKQKPPKAPVSSGGRGKLPGNKGFETMKEYFVDDMSQRKSRVKTPFGIITIDSSDKGMAFEELDNKYGGKVMPKVKRRMGGKVRGYGKAQRGY